MPLPRPMSWCGGGRCETGGATGDTIHTTRNLAPRPAAQGRVSLTCWSSEMSVPRPAHLSAAKTLTPARREVRAGQLALARSPLLGAATCTRVTPDSRAR